jgi:hypothetical protein
MPQYLSVTDDHLSKRPAFFVIAKRFNNPVERKHSIYDRLQPIYGDGSIHGNELSAIASKNDAERGYGIVEQIDVDLGCSIGQAANKVDLSVQSRCLNGLFECPSTNLNDLIYAPATGQLPHGQMPCWSRPIIDYGICSCNLELISFLVVGCRCNHPSTEKIGKLQREERDTARSESQYGITGPEVFERLSARSRQ